MVKYEGESKLINGVQTLTFQDKTNLFFSSGAISLTSWRDGESQRSSDNVKWSFVSATPLQRLIEITEEKKKWERYSDDRFFFLIYSK